MKVHELMLILGSVDPDSEVVVRSNNPELGCNVVAALGVAEYPEGNMTKGVKFVDMFDGTAYSHDVYAKYGGNTKLIQITDY